VWHALAASARSPWSQRSITMRHAASNAGPATIKPAVRRLLCDFRVRKAALTTHAPRLPVCSSPVSPAKRACSRKLEEWVHAKACSSDSFPDESVKALLSQCPPAARQIVMAHRDTEYHREATMPRHTLQEPYSQGCIVAAARRGPSRVRPPPQRCFSCLAKGESPAHSRQPDCQRPPVCVRARIFTNREPLGRQLGKDVARYMKERLQAMPPFAISWAMSRQWV